MGGVLSAYDQLLDQISTGEVMRIWLPGRAKVAAGHPARLENLPSSHNIALFPPPWGQPCPYGLTILSPAFPGSNDRFAPFHREAAYEKQKQSNPC